MEYLGAHDDILKAVKVLEAAIDAAAGPFARLQASVHTGCMANEVLASAREHVARMKDACALKHVFDIQKMEAAGLIPPVEEEVARILRHVDGMESKVTPKAMA